MALQPKFLPSDSSCLGMHFQHSMTWQLASISPTKIAILQGLMCLKHTSLLVFSPRSKCLESMPLKLGDRGWDIDIEYHVEVHICPPAPIPQFKRRRLQRFRSRDRSKRYWSGTDFDQDTDRNDFDQGTDRKNFDQGTDRKDSDWGLGIDIVASPAAISWGCF